MKGLLFLFMFSFIVSAEGYEYRSVSLVDPMRKTNVESFSEFDAIGHNLEHDYGPLEVGDVFDWKFHRPAMNNTVDIGVKWHEVMCLPPEDVDRAPGKSCFLIQVRLGPSWAFKTSEELEVEKAQLFTLTGRWPGDSDGNLNVDSEDLLMVIINAQINPEDTTTDFDGNGVTDEKDIDITYSHVGTSVPISSVGPKDKIAAVWGKLKTQ